ncbi:MAG: dimethyl sulfoxide reductase anchor subunit [Bacteroidales bacterium]|nr:dimethyl sulfoxide reductase anchor subunit [Bacteroidales bacterium]
MRKGFIFDQNKCVACNACRAACILENGWKVSPRVVYTYNNETITSLPVVNLSLACNHCEKPVCMEGCPSCSYFKDEATGAIVINDEKCIGCKYCKWNCPYDAPKFDNKKKVIGKCNLCYTGFAEGRVPACTYACPTGALGFGDLPFNTDDNTPSWFPEKLINPALKFAGQQNIFPVKIIPEQSFETDIVPPKDENYFKSSLYSLLFFSFLSALSVAYLGSSVIRGINPDLYLFLTITVLAAIGSLFHLGKVTRAWRAVLNINSSPLSLEIVSFIIYSIVSVTAVYSELPALMIISSVAGLLFLLSIDNVYTYAEKPKPSGLHSGQTFISSLLMIAFLSGSLIPFIFIAILKIFLSWSKSMDTGNRDSYTVLRIIRIALLVISGAALIYYRSLTNFITALFLTGELLDRMIFYIDFDQLNIKTSIIRHITSLKNEKERS